MNHLHYLMVNTITKKNSLIIIVMLLDEIANNDRIVVVRKNQLILLESIMGFGIGFLGGLVGLVLAAYVCLR